LCGGGGGEGSQKSYPGAAPSISKIGSKKVLLVNKKTEKNGRGGGGGGGGGWNVAQNPTQWQPQALAKLDLKEYC